MKKIFFIPLIAIAFYACNEFQEIKETSSLKLAEIQTVGAEAESSDNDSPNFFYGKRAFELLNFLKAEMEAFSKSSFKDLTDLLDQLLKTSHLISFEEYQNIMDQFRSIINKRKFRIDNGFKRSMFSDLIRVPLEATQDENHKNISTYKQEYKELREIFDSHYLNDHLKNRQLQSHEKKSPLYAFFDDLDSVFTDLDQGRRQEAKERAKKYHEISTREITKNFFLPRYSELFGLAQDAAAYEFLKKVEYEATRKTSTSGKRNALLRYRESSVIIDRYFEIVEQLEGYKNRRASGETLSQEDEKLEIALKAELEEIKKTRKESKETTTTRNEDWFNHMVRRNEDYKKASGSESESIKFSKEFSKELSDKLLKITSSSNLSTKEREQALQELSLKIEVEKEALKEKERKSWESSIMKKWEAKVRAKELGNSGI